jgi:hypothetical protein
VEDCNAEVGYAISLLVTRYVEMLGGGRATICDKVFGDGSAAGK